MTKPKRRRTTSPSTNGIPPASPGEDGDGLNMTDVHENEDWANLFGSNSTAQLAGAAAAAETQQMLKSAEGFVTDQAVASTTSSSSSRKKDLKKFAKKTTKMVLCANGQCQIRL